MHKGIIEYYRKRLPVAENTRVITLHEGNTPLVKLDRLPKQLALDIEIYVKFEGLNPTGSFKDRGMTMAVTQAVAEGSQAVICASTGNTSASAAAYAARAGLRCFVLIPSGKIALGKLAQALMHDAIVLQIQGNFDQALDLVKQIAKRLPLSIVNSINPFRIAGQKTAAFEIIDELNFVPDYHCLPVGNAGNISAYWLGYTEYFNEKMISKRPHMLGYQAEGAAPFIVGAPIANPDTIATAIRIGHPQSWQTAVAATQESAGWFASATDDMILTAQRWLAGYEGVFCEPASAISIAGLVQDYRAGKIPVGSKVVCTLTGHGLKDPDIAMQQCQHQLQSVACDLNALEKAITAI